MKMLSAQNVTSVSGGCRPHCGPLLRPVFHHGWGGWRGIDRNTNVNVNVNHIHLPQGVTTTTNTNTGGDEGGNDDCNCDC